MRNGGIALFAVMSLVISVAVWTGPAGSETLSDKIGKSDDEKIVISSKVLEVDNIKKIVTFGGGVRAVRGDFTIDCDRMVVYYEGLSDVEKSSSETKARIDKIVALGNVKVVRSQGGMATAEKGVFFESEDKVVLTGNPVVKRGEDFVQGDRITIFLDEDRSLVESSGEKRVKAVIFPDKKKEQR
jgi:lipopolysaccharide export system protein LptA